MAPAFWVAYLRALDGHPVRTKAITGGTSFILSQSLSQVIVGGQVANLAKVRDFAAWGFCNSMIAHFWQIFMQRHGPSALLPKLLLDHAAYRAPFLVLFGVYVRLMEGLPFGDALKTTFAAQPQLQPVAAKLWLSSNVFNFTIVPENLRVLYQNIVQFFWVLYLARKMRESQVSPALARGSPTSFVLIGGAMHCGRHFDKLRPFLEAGGNEVIAPDLPGLGEDKCDPRAQTLETHGEAIVAAMERAVHKPVVLVGHSLAGISISAAAEAKPELIKRLVFLSAETRPGAPWGETATNPGPPWLTEGLLDFPDGMMTAVKGKEERLAEVFYSGASPADVKTMAKLLRPQPAYSEGFALSTARYGSVPKAYVKTLQDQVNLPVHQDTWHHRLGEGVPKFELDCGHGSFVSNPQQLAEVLKRAAAL